jgi:hypothetical protein
MNSDGFIMGERADQTDMCHRLIAQNRQLTVGGAIHDTRLTALTPRPDERLSRSLGWSPRHLWWRAPEDSAPLCDAHCALRAAGAAVSVDVVILVVAVQVDVAVWVPLAVSAVSHP